MILIAKTFFLARVHNVPYLTAMKIHYRLFVLELFIDLFNLQQDKYFILYY